MHDVLLWASREQSFPNQICDNFRMRNSLVPGAEEGEINHTSGFYNSFDLLYFKSPSRMEGEAFRKLGRLGTLLWLCANTESLHLSPPNLGIANPLLYAVT